MGLERKKVKFNWFRFGLVAIIIYFIYVCLGQQYQLYVINRETDMARQQLATVSQLRQELDQEREYLNNPAYIEKLAREELGLVKAGEVPYISSTQTAAGKNK